MVSLDLHVVRHRRVPYHIMTGLKGGMPLILAHGLATNLSMWEHILPSLEKNFLVIRYDSRGHGASPTLGNDFTLEDLTLDVINLLDHLKIEQADFVGLSMGGMVGMGLSLNHPDRVRRLVVCDARADAPEAYRDAWDKRISMVKEGGMTAISGQTVERWFTPTFKCNSSAVARMQAMVEGTQLDGYIGSARALKKLDYKRRLATMVVPTLYLVGDQDAGASPEEMRAIHSLTPGSLFHVLVGAGHLSAVEKPEEVGKLIFDFLTR